MRCGTIPASTPDFQRRKILIRNKPFWTPKSREREIPMGENLLPDFPLPEGYEIRDLDDDLLASPSIEVDPLAVDPRKALASLLADRGRVREAIEVLEAARDLDPGDEAIRKDLERFWRKLQGG